ncbi:MAG: hypothetical protein DRI69_09215 [Bacteroidetes bacterium]|nr:MAG: hypothetical protein DRI69_09215 [Bacteroidota bacterium]
MFQESPFSGVCAYAIWEVILMLVGTLLLGLLLGYLIWGWTRRKLREAEAQITSLTTANGSLKEQLSELTATTTHQQQELDSLNTLTSSQRQQLASLTVSNSNLKKQLDEFAASGQEHQSEIEKWQSALADHETQISDLQNQIAEVQSLNSDLERLVKKLRKEKAKKPRKDKPRSADSMSSALMDSEQGDRPDTVLSKSEADPFSSDSGEERQPAPEPKLLTQASEIFGREIMHNDLVLIEGIGPKIAEVLINSGISSWEKLSGTSRHILRVILDTAGSRFHGHKPKTWPRQALMAANGEWKKLKAYQEVLMGGK